MISRRSNHVLLNWVVYALVVVVLLLGLTGCEKKLIFTKPTPIYAVVVEPTPIYAVVVGPAQIYDVVVVFLRHVPPYCPDVDNGTNPNACSPWWEPENQALILPPRHTAKKYETILNQLVNDYYLKNSYDQIKFNFLVLVNPNRADGWWDAPHSIQDYNLGEDANNNPVSLHQDGVTVAYQAIGDELFNYDRVVAIHGYQGRGGQACCVHTPVPFYGVQKDYIAGSKKISLYTAWVAEDANDDLLAAILSHELGHTLGAPDQYNVGLGNWPAMGPWDTMGDDPYFNHFGAWTKYSRGWIPQVTDMYCIKGFCSITAVLDPLEYPGNNALRVPFTTWYPFEGYFAECRRKVNHDENIPEEGLLITHVDENRQGAVAQVVASPTNFFTAALQPGEAFIDTQRKITITNLSQPGDSNCTVDVERGGPPAPDPAIFQDDVEKTGKGYLAYTSYDIWLDSPKNGWDVYPDSEIIMVYPPHTTPQPGGFGDPFWVGHENRIRFRILNAGTGDADYVIVEVYVKQPIIVSPPGPGCEGTIDRMPAGDLVGIVVIDHLEVHDSYYGFVPWTPETNAPAKVTVRIQDYPGELSHTNNVAIETYQHLYFVGAGMDRTVGTFTVRSVGCENRIPFYIFPFPCSESSPKPTWDVSATPNQGMLDPGDALDVQVMAQPPAGSQAGDSETICLGVFALPGDVFTTVGGFAFRAQVVNPSQLTCLTPAEIISLGSTVPVTGGLTPPQAGETLALEYRDPGGVFVIRNLFTDASGNYADSFVPTMFGAWTVQAFWQGNDKYAPVESAVCNITVGRPTFTFEMNASCRSGPGQMYDNLGFVAAGETVEVEGRNDDSTWFYVLAAGDLRCWVGVSTGTLNGDPERVPVREAPPPLATPTPINCSKYASKDACVQNGCTWVPDGAVPGYCRNP